MRLLEKSDAARNRERDLPARQFKLQFQRVKMGAVKDSHPVQSHAFFMQLQNALRDEERLLRGVFTYDQSGAISRFARRREFLGELSEIGGNGRVRDGQNFG